MLEQASSATVQTKPDAGYASWRGSMQKAVMRLDPEGRTAGPIPTFGTMMHETALAAQGHAQAYAPGSGVAADGTTPDIAYTDASKQDDGFSFHDLLDTINPLQHLPVIGTLYRKITGDTMTSFSEIVGGALFGGPIGAAASTINVCVKEATGKDITENAFSMAGLDVTPGPAKKPDLSYDSSLDAMNENAASSASAMTPVNNLVPANCNSADTQHEYPQKQANAANAYAMAAGHRNFAARTLPSQSWNA